MTPKAKITFFADNEDYDEDNDEYDNENENEDEHEYIEPSLFGVKADLQVEIPHAIAPSLSDPFENDDFHVYVYCFVELKGSSEKRYYRTEDRSFKKGDAVLIPDPLSGRILEGIIRSVEHHMRFSVPQPVKETFEIIRRAE